MIQCKILAAIKMMFSDNPKAPGDISQFGVLSLTIGTGNIVDVSIAVLAGGSGTVLWMWLHWCCDTQK